MSKKRRVVITGMGLVSCFGSDVDEFYKKLLAGESGIGPITSFDAEELPTRFGATVQGFNPEEFLDKKQARRVDPCIAYGVAAGKMALRSAGLLAAHSDKALCGVAAGEMAIEESGTSLDALDKSRCGILIGSGMGGMATFTDGVETLVTKGYKRVTPFFVPYILTNMPGALLAIELGFKGPNYSISTACATSNYSIVAAADHIRNGHADLMLAGGCEAAINKMCYAGFIALKALSRNNDNMKGASRPWDTSRDGFVIGEGCGVLVLESLEHALARGAHILAEYKGGSISCDAHHMTEPTPDGSDVARCIIDALADADLSADQIDYINAHATATPVGDLCEVRAVKKVFGPHLSRIKMNSTKSMIGHGLGAAGALEAIATIMAMKSEMVHPTMNLENPEPELEGIDVVRGAAQKHKIKRAISNSFGFGGHNSVIVLEKYDGEGEAS